MKFLLSYLLTFLCIHSLHAQCDSTFFRYTGTFIKDMSLIDTSRIIGVGDNGYIIKSYDGGISWKNIPTFNSFAQQAVQFTSDSVGYSVGNYRTILKTEDQGESWISLFANVSSGYSNIYDTFNDLFFFNDNRGYIAGNNGSIISTYDGGRTWNNNGIFTSNRLNSITFISDSVGFTCGSSSSFYKTTNGGRTWEIISLPGVGFFTNFQKIKFINNSTGFLVGNTGQCFKTLDAGNTWTRINIPIGDRLGDIYFQNDLKGFLTTDGLIYHTLNGGDSWNLNFNYPSRYASHYGINADKNNKKILIAGGGGYGESSGHNGRNILSTTDGGTTFTSLSRNGRLQYFDLFFLNDSVGFIAGEEGFIQKTSDYGESWKPLMNVPSTGNNGGNVTDIFFLDELNGYASTDNIYKTSDGGQSWIKTTTPGTNQTYYLTLRIHFLNTLKGLLLNNGSVVKTTNGGTSWQKVVQSGLFYTDLAVTPNGKAFVVGYNGELDISLDEGTTWNPYNLQTAKYLTSVYFYNNDIGFIGTDDSTIFKTIDGGQNWIKINTGITFLQVKSFKFINESTGYLIAANNGGNSRIYKTNNGGLTWFLVKTEIQNMSRLDGHNIVYCTGENGIILKLDKLQKPGIPGYITGLDKVCVNFKSYYATGSMNGVEYNWMLEGGGTHAYKNNFDTALFTNPGLHKISVSVSNACGVSPVRQFTTEAILFQPTIDEQDSILTATEGLTYQWFKNYYWIPEAQGGKSRSIVAKESGSYTVQVKSLYGCTLTSPAINYVASRLLCPGGDAILTVPTGSNFYFWQRDTGIGFVNILPDIYYEGVTTNSLLLKNIPSSWYGYKFRCINNYGAGDILSIKFLNAWTGDSNANWEDTNNWSCGNLPDENTDVVIDSGTVVINSNVTIRKLTIKPQATITVQPGFTLTITH